MTYNIHAVLVKSVWPAVAVGRGAYNNHIINNNNNDHEPYIALSFQLYTAISVYYIMNYSACCNAEANRIVVGFFFLLFLL